MRILLLEDEVLIAMSLEAMIEDCGGVVVGTAGSCGAALQMLTTLPIDAAILDFILRDEDCGDVADALDAKGIPWAVCTGTDVHVLPARFESVPALAKPFRQSEVQHMLDELEAVRGPSMRRA